MHLLLISEAVFLVGSGLLINHVKVSIDAVGDSVDQLVLLSIVFKCESGMNFEAVVPIN
jgi:hypothetical protein